MQRCSKSIQTGETIIGYDQRVLNFGLVWYNTRSLANILSMTAVCKVCQITMNKAVEVTICVHQLDGSMIKYIPQFTTGLYYYDTSKLIGNMHQNHIFLFNVNGNKEQFTSQKMKAID